MTCDDLGRYANANNLLSQYPRFLLSQGEAQSIVADMVKQVRASWHSVLRAQGVSERDVETMKGAFVYGGFELI